MLLLFNTTRTTSGPLSTGATIAMDGGVAAAVAVQHNARTHFQKFRFAREVREVIGMCGMYTHLSAQLERLGFRSQMPCHWMSADT